MERRARCLRACTDRAARAGAQELEDCCQLVKANSIQGNKESSVHIVYTPWANLRKTSECVPRLLLLLFAAAARLRASGRARCV